jgi:RHS repeat-associated protein
VFAELFVQRDEERRIVRKVMRTALGMDERFYAYDAAGRLIAGGEMVAAQGRDPHVSRAAKGTQGDRQSSGQGGQGASIAPVELTGQPLGQSSVQAKVQSVVQARMLTETYLYGPVGERLASAHAGAGEVRYAYDNAGRLVQAGAERFAYDDHGRLVRRLSAGGETRCAYDAAGNLVAVALPDGRVVEYLLDAAGRRIAKSVNGVMLEKYAWRGAATLEGTSRPDGSGLCRFLYQQGSRMPACMESAGQRYSIAFDHAGTPFAVANANGDLIQAYKHDAFGNVISMLAENVRIPFGFGGGLLDADTGLVHLGYREYDPRIGRFIQPDPLGYAGGDVDVYGYCLDDPVNLVDPLGLEPIISGTDKDMIAQQTGKPIEGKGEPGETPKTASNPETDKKAPDITEQGESIPDVSPNKGKDISIPKYGVNSRCVEVGAAPAPRAFGVALCKNVDKQNNTAKTVSYSSGVALSPGVSVGVSAGRYTTDSSKNMEGRSKYITYSGSIGPVYGAIRGVQAETYSGLEFGAGLSLGGLSFSIEFGEENAVGIGQ